MTCDIDELLQQACDNKFLCNLAEKDIQVLILQLLCNLSGGAGQQAFSGDGAPSASLRPAFGAGVYYDYTNREWWGWNPVTQQWQ